MRLTCWQVNPCLQRDRKINDGFYSKLHQSIANICHLVGVYGNTIQRLSGFMKSMDLVRWETIIVHWAEVFSLILYLNVGFNPNS